jgi:hypothetical protein
MAKETWKKVDGYPDYEISNLGAVRSQRWGDRISFLKPLRSTTGYLTVYLYRDGDKRRNVKVHKLVAGAFLSKKIEGNEVNHKNGKKLDNTARNLEWVTRSGNTRHAYAHGLRVANVKNAVKARLAKIKSKKV